MISFDCAEVLGYRYSYQFLGENFNYRNEKNLTIKGRVGDLTNYSGVSPTWNSMEVFLSGLQDFDELVINGLSFGSGFITDIQFDQGVDVREKRYTASLLIHETGSLHNLTGAYYSELSQANGFKDQDFRLVNDLSEDFEFTRGDNGTYEYSRNISMSIESGDGSNAINLAKDIANSLFSYQTSLPVFHSQYPNFHINSGKRYFSEEYDLINSSYSFSENFKFQSGNLPYIWNYGHSLTYDELGYFSVEERGNIEGIVTSGYETALGIYNSQIPNSYSRCSGVLTNYLNSNLWSGYSGNYVLKNQPITKNRNLKINSSVASNIKFRFPTILDTERGLFGNIRMSSIEVREGNTQLVKTEQF